MSRLGSSPFAFPEFAGTTRRLVLWNLVAFFALLVLGLASRETAFLFTSRLSLIPEEFLHGALWQPFTYSFIHVGLLGPLLELLSLWFLARMLEESHGGNWLLGLYSVSVIACALSAVALDAILTLSGHPQIPTSLIGSMGGIFGLLTAIGILHGDLEFLLFFTIRIKARYLAALYGLIAIAQLFGESRINAFAMLGAACAAWFYVKIAPRRGIGLLISERWYGLRNGYYRWKRRRAARKFEVYMKKQGRTVRFDGQGRYLDEDDQNRWN